MKLKQSAQLRDSSLHLHPAAHPVRVIKAGKLPDLPRAGKDGAAANGSAAPESPVVRIVESGADYCDLEIVCSCGQTTRFRCWNAPGKDEKGAV
jgi:hypothetical protein